MTSPRSTVSALQRLQEWYKSQCDGDWEHGYGVRIGTLDNPSWRLEIELTDTPLQYKSFTEVKRDYDHETEWLTCYLRDGKFQGSCGPEKLEEMIGQIRVLTRDSQHELALAKPTPSLRMSSTASTSSSTRKKSRCSRRREKTSADIRLGSDA